jgi:predicted dinucleotide-binding enzyme
MNYAIIGFGKIGHALAKAFARNGIQVSVATTRAPGSFASDAAARFVWVRSAAGRQRSPGLPRNAMGRKF